MERQAAEGGQGQVPRRQRDRGKKDQEASCELVETGSLATGRLHEDKDQVY